MLLFQIQTFMYNFLLPNLLKSTVYFCVNSKGLTTSFQTRPILKKSNDINLKTI